MFDPRVVRPADPELIEAMARARLVVTAEDGLAHGGAGSYLAVTAQRHADALGIAGPRKKVLGVPTTYLAQAKPDAILARLGLDGPGIAEATRRALARASRIERTGRGEPGGTERVNAAVRDEPLDR